MPTTTTSATDNVGRSRLNCPSCGVALTVRHDMAGKNAKCRCGHVFPVPSVAQLLESARKASEEMALSRGYAPAHKRVQTGDEHPQPKDNVLLDLVLPLVLLPVGVVLTVVQAMHFQKNVYTFADVIGTVTISVATSLGLMILAVLGAGLSLGIVFHTKPWQTALRIASIALIPSALGGIVDHAVGDINGNILGVLTAVALYTALVKVVLRLPWDHTGVIVFVCWTVRTFTMYAIYKMQGANSGSWI